MNKVKPFPHRFCEGCMLNGCYPWNRNPALCCSEFGGIMHPLFSYNEAYAQCTRCLSRKEATEFIWKAYLNDKKRESKGFEDLRKKAIDGEAFTNQILPEHYFALEG